MGVAATIMCCSEPTKENSQTDDPWHNSNRDSPFN